MTAYYNEKDPFAAQWLRNLIAANLIAPGDVDERDIQDVVPLDLARYVQCHFFAGIGVWSYAMRRAGWPDDHRGWTGSCPCQPFSTAGAGGGFDDERHLWPHFHWLISQCRPAIVFGEQVASKNGLGWVDLVQADLEASNYAFGKADLCAAGFGAPHIRQRLYWVAESDHAERRSDAAGGHQRDWAHSGRTQGAGNIERRGGAVELGAIAAGLQERVSDGGVSCGTFGAFQRKTIIGTGVHVSELANTDGGHAGAERQQRGGQQRQQPQNGGLGHNAPTGPTDNFWRDADWLLCRDGKWRPVEPGTFPLAHGAANRVGRLRGYGNAIVAPQAEEFIRVAMEYAP